MKLIFDKIKLIFKNSDFNQILKEFVKNFNLKYYIKELGKIVKNFFRKIPDYPFAMKIYKDVKLIFNFEMEYHLAYQQFLGIYQSRVIQILNKYLKKGDVFIDVGANIGYITAIGAGFVGKRGKVYSFEPVPKCFELLSRNKRLNKDYNITINKCALGSNTERTNIKISSHNLGWNTMVPHFMKETDIQEVAEVNVIRLDDYIERNKINKVSFIKIDVEGYEFEVLQGLTNFFRSNQNGLPILLVEVVPSDFYDINDLKKFMKKFNYRAFDINKKHHINLIKLTEPKDILFVPYNY